MYHDQSCRCIQCAARPIVTKTKNDMTRTGDAALKRFTKETESLLSVDIRDSIADTIARRLEDFMSYTDATVISADLAQNIHSDITDIIDEIKSSAEIIVGSFVKSTPIIVSTALLQYEKTHDLTTTVN